MAENTNPPTEETVDVTEDIAWIKGKLTELTDLSSLRDGLSKLLQQQPTSTAPASSSQSQPPVSAPSNSQAPAGDGAQSSGQPQTTVITTQPQATEPHDGGADDLPQSPLPKRRATGRRTFSLRIG